MKDFFAFIYEIFRSFYGGDLADHLYGVDAKSASLYSWVGVIMVISSLLLALIFYKVIDSPKPRKSLSWFIYLLINAAINFFLGFYLPYRDFQAKNISAEILKNIDAGNIVAFGVANAIVATLFFMFFSIFIRRLSNNNRLTPFGTKIL